MTGKELYEIARTHPRIQALIPRSFFPTLPMIRRENGVPVIRFFYTNTFYMPWDCIAVTVTAVYPRRFVSLEVLEPDFLQFPVSAQPDPTEEMLAYYDRCGAVLAMEDTEQQSLAIQDLEKLRSDLMRDLLYSWRFRRSRPNICYIGVMTGGKTTYSEAAFDILED